MQFKTIMVPFDGSEPSKRAYLTALQFAVDDPSVTVRIVRIIPAGDIPVWLDNDSMGFNAFQFRMFDGAQYQEIMDSLVTKARNEVDEAVAQSSNDGATNVAIDVVVSQNVSDAIAEYVEEHNCHLVIMGSRGLGGVRGLLGSVSYGVLQRLEVPVMIVK